MEFESFHNMLWDVCLCVCVGGGGGRRRRRGVKPSYKTLFNGLQSYNQINTVKIISYKNPTDCFVLPFCLCIIHCILVDSSTVINLDESICHFRGVRSVLLLVKSCEQTMLTLSRCHITGMWSLIWVYTVCL